MANDVFLRNSNPNENVQFGEGGGNGRPPRKKRRRKPYGAILLLIVVIILIAVGVWFFFFRGASSLGSFGSGPVAMVNGEEVTGAEFEAQLSKTENLLHQQAGALGTTEEKYQAFLEKNRQNIRQRVLSTIISRMLVLQAAEKAGIAVETSAVDAEFDRQAKSLNATTTIADALEKLGLTESEAKQNIKEQLIIDKYVKEKTQVKTTVSQKEVATLYDTLVAQVQSQQKGTTTASTTTPSLGEVDEQLKARLKQRRQLLAAQDVLTRLQASSKVLVYAEDLAYPPIVSQAP